MTRPSENPTAPKAAPNSNEPPAESARSCLWRFFTVSTWIAVAIVLIAIGFRMWFLYWYLDPARRAELDKLDNEIIEIPPEWQHTATKPPDEVIEFHQWFNEEMERLRFKHDNVLSYGTTSSVIFKLQHGDELTTSQQKAFAAFLTDFKPIIERTSVTVSKSAYTADTESYVQHNSISPPEIFRAGTELMAYNLVNQNKYRTAIEIAILPSRYMHHDAVASFTIYLSAGRFLASSGETIVAIAEKCHDSQIVRYGLKLLTEERELAYPDHIDKLYIVGYVQTISEMKATGYPADLSSQPLADLLDQEIQTQTEPYLNWIVTHLPPQDPRVATAKEDLKLRLSARTHENYGMQILESITQYQSVRRLGKLVMGYSPAALILQRFGWLSSTSIKVRISQYTARYELARLRIAQRIVELESGTTQTLSLGPAAITPVMQTIPDDPFSTATPPMPMRFSKSENRFYSIGPDGDDDKMKVKYDADYGNIADGDIFLDPPPKP